MLSFLLAGESATLLEDVAVSFLCGYGGWSLDGSFVEVYSETNLIGVLEDGFSAHLWPWWLFGSEPACCRGILKVLTVNAPQGRLMLAFERFKEEAEVGHTVGPVMDPPPLITESMGGVHFPHPGGFLRSRLSRPQKGPQTWRYFMSCWEVQVRFTTWAESNPYVLSLWINSRPPFQN